MKCLGPLSTSTAIKIARGALSAIAATALFAAASGTALANAGIGLAANFPSTAIISATGVPANIDFVNTSTPTTLTVEVNSISLTPSCAHYNGTVCDVIDNGVFAISPTGTGRAGTACAGVTFTFVPHPGATDGMLDVIPGSPISLGVPGAPNKGDECIIDFTFDVLKAPAIDGATDAGHPGLQTLPSGIVNGTASDFSTAQAFGTTFITVVVPTTIGTTASIGGAIGTQLADQATLAGGTSATGTITFKLYGPDDATCAAAPVFISTRAVSGNGTYTSDAFTTLAAGVYRWVASYSGDANNSASTGACNDPGESSTITQSTPALATLASAGGIIGSTLSDTATLSAGTNPTGTITFSLYGPNDATCAATPIFTSTKAVSGNNNYTSDSYTPLVAGVYRWVASYSGDANNVALTRPCNDTNETATITQASPAIVTVASAGGALGAALSDTATLSGGVNPTGSITFNLYGPNDTTCTAGAVSTSTKAVAGNGNYTSNSFTPVAPGTYYWTATYSGDANNAGAAGACGALNESAVITKTTPAIVTTASAGGAIGTSLSDSATLSGGTNPTGTITFNLYGPDDATCATTPVFTSIAPVASGNGVYGSAAFTFTVAGTYRWTATYSGDANNATAAGACNATGESAVITKTTPAIVTTASAGGAIGTSLSDSATLSGGSNPTGTITFNLYGPTDATCSSTPVFTSIATVASGNGVYGSTAFTSTAAGTYRWTATYSGDANNVTAAGACNATGESAVITKTTPAIATTASAGGTIGTSLSDSATLSGGTNPTGTITFNLYGPTDATCSSTPVFTSTVAVASGNGVYGSTAFTSTAAGTYRWTATYSGDANNVTAAGACNATGESAVITKTTPAIATTASAGGTIGTSLSDSATLSGGSNPTGTITFNLYGPNNTTCTGAPAFTSTAAVASGNGVYGSTAFTSTAPGTYRWIAAYGGDANNVAVTGACNDSGESAVVTKSTPAIATTASAGGGVGTLLTDSATLSGGTNPTGTITFSLYGPNNATCTGAPAFTSTAAVASGNGVYGSGAFTTTALGTYRWIAAYGGDANNAAVTGACNDSGESATINTVTPTLVTTASATIKLGGTLTDTAVLAGGSAPTGTITFKAYGPNDATCSTVVFTSNAITVAGNGSYTSAGPFTPAAIGTYRWIASYSGDATNVAVTGACNAANESVVVTQATPAIATTASAGGAIGTALSDSAVLTGGVNATGTITFRLYGPDDATCTATPVFTSSPVTVAGNGTYPSGSFTSTLAGVYRWIASYSGDTNNAAIAGACNDANENVTVTGSSPAIVTQTQANVVLGAPVHDQATLSGGTLPTGTISFNLYGPDDAACSGAAIFTTSVSVTDNGVFLSPSFTPTAVGTYRWIAAYSGDVNNIAVTGACNDTAENVVVHPPIVVQNVPTLSQWALMLMGLMLMVVASTGLARRQR